MNIIPTQLKFEKWFKNTSGGHALIKVTGVRYEGLYLKQYSS